jgi:hypothetical protein
MEIVHTKYLGLFQIDIRIGGVMVSVLTSSEVDSGFEPWSGQSKDYYKSPEQVNLQWYDAVHYVQYFIVLGHWSSPRIDMLPYSPHYFDSEPTSRCSYSLQLRA